MLFACRYSSLVVLLSGMFSRPDFSLEKREGEREREREREREKLISPLPRGGRRICSSILLSRRPFGYYLPIASYGTIFAAKWSSNGGLEAVVPK